MNATFQIAGIAFLGAAIAGGASKALGFDFPPLTSIKRQVMLGAVGVGFLVAAVITGTAAHPALGYEALRGTTWRGTITVGLWRGAVGPPSHPLKMVFDSDGTVLVTENYRAPDQDIVTEHSFTAHCRLRH